MQATNQTWPDLCALPYIQFSASRRYVRNRRISISIIPSAGPTFISKTTIVTIETGKQFTFQDFMGVGTSAAFQH
jgi:hypothetical protein